MGSVDKHISLSLRSPVNIGGKLIGYKIAILFFIRRVFHPAQQGQPVPISLNRLYS
jgi:hypothetical protein